MTTKNESARAELRTPEEIAEGLADELCKPGVERAAARLILLSLAESPRLLKRDEQGDAYRWLMHNGGMLIDRTALVKFRQDGQDFARTPGGRVKDLRWCVTDLGRAVADVLAKRGAR